MRESEDTTEKIIYKLLQDSLRERRRERIVDEYGKV